VAVASSPSHPAPGQGQLGEDDLVIGLPGLGGLETGLQATRARTTGPCLKNRGG
jgi:hypothetical protein